MCSAHSIQAWQPFQWATPLNRPPIPPTGPSLSKPLCLHCLSFPCVSSLSSTFLLSPSLAFYPALGHGTYCFLLQTAWAAGQRCLFMLRCVCVCVCARLQLFFFQWGCQSSAPHDSFQWQTLLLQQSNIEAGISTDDRTPNVKSNWIFFGVCICVRVCACMREPLFWKKEQCSVVAGYV